jgi:hypothetical protein
MTDSEQQPTDYLRARREAAALLGVDLDHMSAADALRVDLAVVLRRAIDAQTESAFDGAPIDLTRLMAAIERLTALLPERELPQSHREDPREALLEIYTQMRARGEDFDRAQEPTLRDEVAALRAENERLRLLAGDSTVIDPPLCDIVPPGERAECDAGPTAGADDPPRRSSVIIEGTVAATGGREPPPSKPARPFVNGTFDLVAAYPAPDEPWRDHLNRHYDRWADNR